MKLNSPQKLHSKVFNLKNISSLTYPKFSQEKEDVKSNQLPTFFLKVSGLSSALVLTFECSKSVEKGRKCGTKWRPEKEGRKTERFFHKRNIFNLRIHLYFTLWTLTKSWWTWKCRHKLGIGPKKSSTLCKSKCSISTILEAIIFNFKKIEYEIKLIMYLYEWRLVMINQDPWPFQRAKGTL